jgi:hypothetical protein
MLKKIKDHFENKKYAKIFRTVGKKSVEISTGYIVAYAADFIILQETDDFKVLGYNVLPVKQLKKIRFNKWDKYYNKIMIWEGEAEKVGINYNIDLTDWQTIFESIKSNNLNVIVQCEDPKIGGFTIGPIINTTKKVVYIQNFDPGGFLDEEPTSIDFESITKVQFDDRYINVFSKYLRNRKIKKSSEQK